MDTAQLLKENKIDGLFVTNPTNIYYLTGFKGVSPTEREALLVLRKPKNILITAKLYKAEAKRVSSDSLEVKVASERDQYEEFIKDSLKNLKNLGFEPHDLKFLEHKKLKAYQRGTKLVPTKEAVEALRKIKYQSEIANIKKAQLITHSAFKEILKTLKIGQSEQEIAEKLVTIMKDKGAHGPSFDPIVASGSNSALPHHQTGMRKVKKGDTLLFDFGAKYKNYCADFSRTVFIGAASTTQQKAYNLVFESQRAAIRKIKPGIKAKKVFEAAHKVFKNERVDSHFIHSLGHGIGLEVHEKPSISAKSKDTLVEGSIFTIEPGLYFKWGGIRIEDIVYINSGKTITIGSPAAFLEI